MQNKPPNVIFIVSTMILVSVVLTMFYGVIYFYRQTQCAHICWQEAKILQQMDGKHDGGVDNYGNPLYYHYTITDTKSVASVTSPGWDSQLGTGDDCRATSVDYNKSKIIGRWVGQKYKQAKEGFIQGLKDKVKWDKEDSTD